MEFSQNGVALAVVVESSTTTGWTISATFSPLQSGFHFYSIELPLEGMDGVGRPTLLRILSPEISVAGPISVDVPTLYRRFPTFPEPFPVYPSGPVTLSQSFELAPGIDRITSLVCSVTFMVCHDDGYCLAPVEDHQFEMPIDLSREGA